MNKNELQTKMQIKRKTKIQQGDKVLHTTIPLSVVEMLGLKKGDSLEWEVNDGKASFKLIKEETEMVLQLTQDTYEQEVMKAEGTVLVDFYADWCGPCKMQGPIVDQLSEERTDVKFCKLNVDDAVAIAMELGISSIPTIMVVKNGEITYKQPGLMQKAQLEALL
jgi:thioredoxin 1